METSYSRIEGTVSRVGQLPLPHPAGALLRSFILEALDAEAAAEYVESRIVSTEEAHRLVSDWIYAVESSKLPCPCVASPELMQPILSLLQGSRPKGTRFRCGPGHIPARWTRLLRLWSTRHPVGSPRRSARLARSAPMAPRPSKWTVEALRGHILTELTQERALPLLDVFFGSHYLQWWIDYTDMPHLTSPEENHWLVRCSVADALRSGCVRLDRAQSSMTEYEVCPVPLGPNDPIKVNGYLALLGDHSRVGITKVDPRFIGTHARFSKSIQLVEFAREMAPGLFQRDMLPASPRVASSQSPPKPWDKGLQLKSVLLTMPLLRVWRLFPQNLRRWAYQGLISVGKYLYGVNAQTSGVQKLPFGLYLKFDSSFECAENEMRALDTVNRHTNIPAPTGLDLVSEVVENDDGWGSRETIRRPFLLMTEVPGAPLSRCMEAISDENYERIGLQVRQAVSQLRSIPKTVNPSMAICNTLGEACRDPRIRDFSAIGPFVDEAAFSQEMRFPDEPSRRGHEIVFTHADLNPRNILVRQAKDNQWEVSGIVDWETAGYYPEYWDCTKSLYEGFRWPQRHNDMMMRVFEAFGDYKAEMDVEKRSWEMGCGL